MRRGQGVGEIRYGGSGFGTLGTGYVLGSERGTVYFLWSVGSASGSVIYKYGSGFGVTSTDPVLSLSGTKIRQWWKKLVKIQVSDSL